MKVLITFGSYALSPRTDPQPVRAGAEMMAISTATALAGRGHAVVLVTDGPAPPAAPGLDVLSGAGAGTSPAPPWVPDVIHAFDLAKPTMVRYGWDLARRRGLPFVVTPSSDRQVWPDTWLGERVCADADRVMTLTSAEADALRLPDPARARRIGQGPSVSGCGDPAAFRRRLPGDGPVTLFLGRRGRLKGLDVLALAAPLVWREAPAAIFAVAGPSEQAGDRVVLPGDPRFVDLGAPGTQLKTDALAGCAVLCLPSRADVFPLVFVEAWTLGRPVISGDFPGAADVVRHDVDGLICAVRPEAVAEAIITLITDPARCSRLGAAGRDRAARELTWQAAAAAAEACYQEVVPRGGMSR